MLARTSEKAAAAGLCVAPLDTLPTVRDVDTIEDLQEWMKSTEHALNDDDMSPSPSVRWYRENLHQTVCRILSR